MGYELINGLTPFFECPFTLLGGEMDEDSKSKCKIPCQKHECLAQSQTLDPEFSALVIA